MPKLVGNNGLGRYSVVTRKPELCSRRRQRKQRLGLRVRGPSNAYKSSGQMPGILRDYAVHKKKEVGGRWLKPRRVVLFQHKLSDGSTVATKGGTQVIDRFWRTLRQHMGTRTATPGSTNVEDRVRSAQWMYLNRGMCFSVLLVNNSGHRTDLHRLRNCLCRRCQ